MKRLGGVAAVLPLAVAAMTLAAAGQPSDPQACARLKDDTRRLLCYDLIFKMEPTAPEKTEKTAWTERIETSKIDDTKSVFLTVQSKEIIDCGWNNGQRIILRLRCLENTTALVISTGCHMTSSRYSDYGDVTYRLDTDKARTVGMQESTNNRSLGLWRGATAIPVIKQMFGKKQLIARMTPYGENSFTATFDISGTEKAVEPLRKACGW